jgi:hypothetical protein
MPGNGKQKLDPQIQGRPRNPERLQVRTLEGDAPETGGELDDAADGHVEHPQRMSGAGFCRFQCSCLSLESEWQ